MELIEVGLLDRVKGWFSLGSPNPNNGGLFDHLEGWWGRFAVWAKLCLFVGIFVVLIAIWVCVSPELAQFIGYLLGGLLLFRQIAISGKRATAAEKTAKAMQKTARSTEKGNIAERFKNAIEHLGHESASIRLGGIYALHHIAQEAKEYRERVFEILCAHIRETTTHKAYKPRKIKFDRAKSEQEYPTIEIQSILNLLFMKTPGCEIYKELETNLENANLAGAGLIKANLQGANLQGANLQKAYLQEANLQDAYLRGTNLQKAYLKGANLRHVILQKADLRKAYLSDANLQGAYLEKINLQDAYLQMANLQEICLHEVNLQKADLHRTDFRYANLIYAENLEIEQLLDAKTLYKAKLPQGTEDIIRQQKPTLFEEPSDEDGA